MQLADIKAVSSATPAASPQKATSSYKVGAGAAIPDGVVGFSIDDIDYSFIPGIGAIASNIADNLVIKINNTGSAKHTATASGDTVNIVAKDVGPLGNDAVIVDENTESGIAPGVIVQPNGGSNSVLYSEIIVVSIGGNDYSFTRHIINSNPSLVRRVLAKGGDSHDLATDSTSHLLAHAIAVRILEQV